MMPEWTSDPNEIDDEHYGEDFSMEEDEEEIDDDDSEDFTDDWDDTSESDE